MARHLITRPDIIAPCPPHPPPDTRCSNGSRLITAKYHLISSKYQTPATRYQMLINKHPNTTSLRVLGGLLTLSFTPWALNSSSSRRRTVWGLFYSWMSSEVILQGKHKIQLLFSTRLFSSGGWTGLFCTGLFCTGRFSTGLFCTVRFSTGSNARPRVHIWSLSDASP